MPLAALVCGVTAMLPDTFDHLLDGRGQIRPSAIDDLLIEMISGKSLYESGGELYATRAPTMAEQDKARIVHTRKVHEARRAGLPTRAEIEATALAHGQIEVADRQEQENLTAIIARQQKARDATRDPLQKAGLAEETERLRSRLIELRMREEELFAHSAEAKAEESRVGFLVACCTLGGQLLDEPVWGSWDDYQNCDRWTLLLDARRSFMRTSHGLPIKIIRAVARSHEWRSRWKAARESGSPLFEGSSADWDTNKRNLAWWTEFYEAIARHPESPPDETVANDDSLQDWINQQVAKKNQKGPSPTAQQKPPPTYIDGHGRRQSMVRVGSETVQVGTPYQVRV